MKNFKLKRLLSLAFIGCLSTLSASTAFAAAGDDISNTATLTYSGGSVVSAPVVFKEDRLLNFTVVKTDVSSISGTASEAGVMTTFRVTNNGNGEQDFLLSAFNAATGVDDPFDAGNDLDSLTVAFVAIYVNSVFNADGTYLLADDGTQSYIDQLPAGEYVDVFVFSTMPAAPLTDGALAVVSLVAQVADDTDGVGGGTGSGGGVTGAAYADDSGNPDTAAEETVFLDTENTINVASGDGVNDGLASDESAYIISAAILGITKSVSIALWNDLTGSVNPKMIPGHNAYIEYTLVVENTGTGSGNLTTLVDNLPADMGLDVDFITNAGPGFATSGTPGDSFQIDTTGTLRPSLGVTYCTAVAAVDGCIGVPGFGGSATVDFSLVGATAIEAGYTAGEIKPGETITVKFNAILQ